VENSGAEFRDAQLSTIVIGTVVGTTSRRKPHTVRPLNGKKKASGERVLPHVPRFTVLRKKRIVLDQIFAAAHNVLIAVN
jgi:hypothetical protein